MACRDYKGPEEEESEDDDKELSVEMFPGTGNDQMLAYFVALHKRELSRNLSRRRQAGMPPSSEHQMFTGLPLPKRARRTEEDCDYEPETPTSKAKTARPRGKGVKTTPSTKGRGRGRGRGGKAANSASASKAYPLPECKLIEVPGVIPVKSQHWKEHQLSALINGCNHLKPVLKGRFKYASDGVELRTLAWQEVSDFVNSTGPPERDAKMCQDKILYFTQKAKKKRQNLDAKYTSGSGQKEDGDFLTELEQGACDYAGEDVTLGIAGMQPADIFGTQTERPEVSWSCYDPNRATKEDYAALYMPSKAMDLTFTGDLLKDEQETMDEEATPDEQQQELDEAVYNNEEEEVEEGVEEEGGQVEEKKKSGTKKEKEASRHNILPRVQRKDMLSICDNFNWLLSEGKKKEPKRNPSSILLARPGASKSKMSLIPEAIKAVGNKVNTMKGMKRPEPDVQIIEEEQHSHPPSRVKTTKKQGIQQNVTSKVQGSKCHEVPSCSQPTRKKNFVRTNSFSTLLHEPEIELEPNANTASPTEESSTYTHGEMMDLLKSYKEHLESKSHTRKTPNKCNTTPDFQPSPSSALKEVKSASAKKKKGAAKKSLFNEREGDEGARAKPTEVAANTILYEEGEEQKMEEHVEESEEEEQYHTSSKFSSQHNSSSAHIKCSNLVIQQERAKEVNLRQTALVETLVSSQENLMKSCDRMSDCLLQSNQHITESLVKSQVRITEGLVTTADSMALSLKCAMTGMLDCIQKQSTALSQSHSKMLTEAKEVASSVNSIQNETGTAVKLQTDRIQEALHALSESTERVLEHILRKEIELVRGLSGVGTAVVKSTEAMAQGIKQLEEKMIGSVTRTEAALNSIVEHITRTFNQSNMSRRTVVNEGTQVDIKGKEEETTVERDRVQLNNVPTTGFCTQVQTASYLTHPEPAILNEQEDAACSLSTFSVLGSNEFFLVQNAEENINMQSGEQMLQQLQQDVKDKIESEGASEADTEASVSDIGDQSNDGLTKKSRSMRHKSTKYRD